MPEISDRPKNRACYQCMVWWFAKKKFEQYSHEESSKDPMPEKGNWAGYHRWMHTRRAQELREMTVSDFVDREYVSEVEVNVDPEQDSNSGQ